MVHQAAFIRSTPPAGEATLTLIQEEVDNDSNKTITVPANTKYKILSLYVEVETDSTSGDRNIEVRYRDTDDEVILDIRMVPAIPAGTFRRLNFYPTAIGTTSAFVGGSGYMPTPSDLILGPGFDLNILDTGSVSVSGDKMLIEMLVLEWQV